MAIEVHITIIYIHEQYNLYTITHQQSRHSMLILYFLCFGNEKLKFYKKLTVNCKHFPLKQQILRFYHKWLLRNSPERV